MHNSIADQTVVLTMIEHRHANHARVFDCAPHDFMILNAMTVIGDCHDARRRQRPNRREFRSEEHTSELQSQSNLVCRLLLEKNNSHTVLDDIITTIMATIQRINIIGSREGSRNRRRLKTNQTGKKFRVGIKSNISTNRNNLISGVDRCIHLNSMKKTTITSINRQTIKI